MDTAHKTMSPERWHALSLEEQLGNIGSEVSRVGRWQHKDQKIFWGAVERALELFDLTLADARLNLAEKIEIARAREVFCDAVFGGGEYQTTFDNLLPYFDQFAVAARVRALAVFKG